MKTGLMITILGLALQSGCAFEVDDSEQTAEQAATIFYSHARPNDCAYTRCAKFNGTRCTKYEVVHRACKL